MTAVHLSLNHQSQNLWYVQCSQKTCHSTSCAH